MIYLMKKNDNNKTNEEQMCDLTYMSIQEDPKRGVKS